MCELKGLAGPKCFGAQPGLCRDCVPRKGEGTTRQDGPKRSRLPAPHRAEHQPGLALWLGPCVMFQHFRKKNCFYGVPWKRRGGLDKTEGTCNRPPFHRHPSHKSSLSDQLPNVFTWGKMTFSSKRAPAKPRAQRAALGPASAARRARPLEAAATRQIGFLQQLLALRFAAAVKSQTRSHFGLGFGFILFACFQWKLEILVALLSLLLVLCKGPSSAV